jgi:putative proteasome-type protease
LPSLSISLRSRRIRTNAGIDHLSTYTKMFTFGIEGERAFVVLTAGNRPTHR